MAQDIINPPNFKSSKLNTSQRRKLRTFVRRFLSITEAAAEIGISRQVLTRVMSVGRGSPDNITKVKAAMSD